MEKSWDRCKVVFASFFNVTTCCVWEFAAPQAPPPLYLPTDSSSYPAKTIFLFVSLFQGRGEKKEAAITTVLGDGWANVNDIIIDLVIFTFHGEQFIRYLPGHFFQSVPNQVHPVQQLPSLNKNTTFYLTFLSILDLKFVFACLAPKINHKRYRAQEGEEGRNRQLVCKDDLKVFVSFISFVMHWTWIEASRSSVVFCVPSVNATALKMASYFLFSCILCYVIGRNGGTRCSKNIVMLYTSYRSRKLLYVGLSDIAICWQSACIQLAINSHSAANHLHSAGIQLVFSGYSASNQLAFSWQSASMRWRRTKYAMPQRRENIIWSNQ